MIKCPTSGPSSSESEIIIYKLKSFTVFFSNVRNRDVMSVTLNIS